MNAKDLRKLTIEETKLFCRNNSDRQVSALGYSQKEYPKAYSEYFEKRYLDERLHEYFQRVFNITIIPNRENLIECFKNRELELNENRPI